MLVPFCLEKYSIANYTNMLANMFVQMLANMLARFAGALTKYSSWSIYQLSCCYTSEYAQTNLIYRRPSFSRDLYWPIKFQIFCDQTINSPYIYAPKHQTKTNLHLGRDSTVGFVKKWSGVSQKSVLFDSGIT